MTYRIFRLVGSLFLALVISFSGFTPAVAALANNNAILNAVLSGDMVTTGAPITYTVDFGTNFTSITQVDYFLSFGDDPLDPGECLEITGDFSGGFGFCNPNTTPQFTRLLTSPCSIHPSVCDAFLDGVSSGQITASTISGSGIASINIASMAITIQGTNPVQVDIDIKPGRFPNRIKLTQNVCNDDDNLYVAILTTPAFNARTVNASTIQLGDPNLSGKATPIKSRITNVDGDGDKDMVLTFTLCGIVTNGALNINSTEMVLTGMTLDGVSITGRDSVKVVH